MQAPAMQADAKKLFVGSLPFRLTEEELQEVFSQFGQVAEVKIVIDKMTGRSRGFGFVTMSTEEEAQAAVDAAAQGMEIDGRALIVNVARPQAPREDRPRFGGGDNNRRYDRPRGGRDFGDRN